MSKKLQNALIQQKEDTEQVVQQITGILGLPLDGQRRVEVTGRNAYVYVRLRNNENEVIQAFNNQVAPAYNLPVLVEREGNRYIVLGVDTQRYENNWNSFAPFLPRHGNTHSFDLETGGGGDVVWVYPRQFTPLLTMPSGSRGGPNVIINPYTLNNRDGTWKYIGNTGTANIANYRPSSPTGAIIVLVYVDSVSGNPGLLVGSGTVFNNNITGVSQIAPYIPTITNPDWIPDSAIRLITGTTIIGWDNIYDVRQFLHFTPTGTGGGGGGGTTIGLGVMAQDEGVPLGTGTVFNFVGTNVVASISGSVVRVFVTGSSGGASLTVDDTDGGSVSNVNRITLTGTTSTFVTTDGAGHALVNIQKSGVDVLEVGGLLSTEMLRLEFESMSVDASGTTARIFPELNGPQGFGFNYQIDEAGSSGTLNFSLKTLAGTNPSTSNRLVFRIGNTRREITSAISHTLPTGTNLMNAGSAELAGLQIDCFVYLIQETGASAGTKIGVSRIPYARIMGDFVNTPTNEKYIAGNWTNFDSNDEVENIGRIRLEKASATGEWAGDSTAIVNRPIYESDWLEWRPAFSGNSSMTYTSVTTNVAVYKISYDTLFYYVRGNGTVGGTPSTNLQCTLPFESSQISLQPPASAFAVDAVAVSGFAFLSAGTPDLLVVRKYDSSAFTAGAGKVMNAQGFYQIG